MTSDYIGQQFNMDGGNNVGINYGTYNNNSAPAVPPDALREVIEAVNALRAQVSPADREIIDASMRTVGTGTGVERQPLRQALSQLAGVATMVGQVGAPVVEAVRKVLAAFGP
jgi:hypothetical protein